MTNKNKKRPQPSGYRGSTRSSLPADPPQRRGLLDGLLGGSRVAPLAGIPRFRTAIWRGLLTVLTTPVLLLGVPLLLLAEWLGVVRAGFQGPFSAWVDAFAIPPLGTSFDASLATGIFGLRGGLLGIALFVALRSVVTAFLVAWIVDSLEVGRVTSGAAVRAVRAIPTTLGVNMAAIALLTVAGFFGPLLGASFVVLIQVAALVGGVYLFVAAPVIAVAERRRMPDCMTRSIRAARLAGTGNLTFAALYVIPALAFVVVPGKPGSQIGVNPSAGAWALVIGANLLHVAMLAAFAYRYLSVAQEVPEGPPARARTRR
jgi:hypothetical protein